MPATTAHHRRRVTPSIEEQDGLLTLFKTIPHLAHQFLRQGRETARTHDLDPHVHHIDERELAIIDALPHVQVLVTPRLRVGVRLQRRRRRSQQAVSAIQLSPHHGDIAAMITRGLILLVSRFVLFIDHNETQVLHRCENRRARTDYDPRRARRQLMPAVHPLALA